MLTSVMSVTVQTVSKCNKIVIILKDKLTLLHSYNSNSFYIMRMKTENTTIYTVFHNT